MVVEATEIKTETAAVAITMRSVVVAAGDYYNNNSRRRLCNDA